MTPEARQKLGLSEMAAYYEGYADGMTTVVERWSESLNVTAEVLRPRTIASDLEEDR